MSEHTKEPWRIDEYGNICTPDGQLLLGGIAIPMSAGERKETAKHNARRIVVCVNACAGIPTVDLAMDKPTFVAMLLQRQTLQQQRDELLAASKAAIAQADDDLAKKYLGCRTAECQAIYDQMVSAIANAEKTG